MKNLRLHPRTDKLALLISLVALNAGAALIPTEWAYRQPLTVATPGLTRVSLPATTFDAAQSNLADLRLMDAGGQEVAYYLHHDLADRERLQSQVTVFRPKSFLSSPAEGLTQLLMATGHAGELDAIELESPAPFFLKAAHVEISQDGNEWQSLGPAIPVFRQFGAEQLRLSLGWRKAAFVRVTLEDFRTRPVAFSGAKLVSAPVQSTPPALTPVGARIIRRDEFAGETVLTISLEGRHVPLARLEFETPEPLFMRRVTMTVREMIGEIGNERTVSSGTLYRVALEGAPTRSQLELPARFTPMTREILVHIHNGDSPPLAIERVQARQHAVTLLFMASGAGNYTLLSGNPQATAPRYDLAVFASEMRATTTASLVPGPIENTPNYQPRTSLAVAPLPDVPLTGAPLDTKDWRVRKPIQILQPGVQELELDPETLGMAMPDFADLRVLHEGNQIPYLREQPDLARVLPLTLAVLPDPKRPQVSVWSLSLPQPGLPLQRLVLTSATPLFQRQIRLYEKIPGPDGRIFESTLATTSWSRTPEPGIPARLTIVLPNRLRSDTLWIETDNGDNPAIILDSALGLYPVVRLIFKTAATDNFSLVYGNSSAHASRYDLQLVAARLLTAGRNAAQLGPSEMISPGHRSHHFDVYIFWGALALVVVVLLRVVAKLLPNATTS